MKEKLKWTLYEENFTGILFASGASIDPVL
jgi:hypothetical protein